MAFREGNNLLGVNACDDNKPPVAVRYLVDPLSPAEMIISPSGDKYTVRSPTIIMIILR